jgi:CHAD domain-containing protein
MAIELDSAQKPLYQLRRFLKSLSRDPSVEDVHELRTEARRLEAVVAALKLHDEKDVRRLLKEISPLRKAAGDVRDMDVMEAEARKLSKHGNDDALAKLMEHLRQKRTESASQLFDRIAKRRKDACRNLKRVSKLVKERLDQNRERPIAKRSVDWSPAEAAAVVLELEEDLSRWPKISEESIHSFRIRVKELRYVLQLTGDADTELVESLGKVKDQIGAWHDWQEMAKIADKVLDADDHDALLKEIKHIEATKLRRALKGANAMRKNNLGFGRRKGPRPVELRVAPVKSAARLAG